MAGNSRRGRRQRVLDAREQARAALGSQGSFELDPPPNKRSPIQPAPAPYDAEHAAPEYVLSLGEVARALSLSREQLEAMIAAGKVEALPTAFSRAAQCRRELCSRVDHAP